MYLNGMAVSWTTKKQGGVSLSSMEAKFVAASEVARELIDLHQMIGKVGLAPVVLMLMHVDNQAAISQIEGGASSIKPSTSTCGTSTCAILLDAVSSRCNTFDPS